LLAINSILLLLLPSSLGEKYTTVKKVTLKLRHCDRQSRELTIKKKIIHLTNRKTRSQEKKVKSSLLLASG
jgi:hypothetical protein